MREWFAKRWVSRSEFDRVVDDFKQEISKLKKDVALNRQAVDAVLFTATFERNHVEERKIKLKRRNFYKRITDNIVIGDFTGSK